MLWSKNLSLIFMKATMSAYANQFSVRFFPQPSAGLSRLLVLGSLFCCGMAGASQDDAFPEAQLQLERTAKLSLMVARGYSDGFAQLRENRTALTTAMAALAQTRFEHCASHVPDPETARKLAAVAAKLPALAAATDTLLGNQESLMRMRAATKAITGGAPRLNELLLQLNLLQAESGARDLRMLGSARLLYKSERLAGYAARYAHDDIIDPVVAFVIDTDKAKILSAIQDLENGSKIAGIVPASRLEKAKLEEITASFAATANALDALKPLLLPIANFRNATYDAIDAAEEMGKALRSVRSDMQARTICAAPPR
ncbi:hypothetical protein F1735_19935 [Massilia sp. CCM 8694]|uniref:NarX-like N-terminal domain-containing protein n=2 Tax=Massilia genomosp. 1 TaxID=2609280 RepID=A0ABX0MVP4_9BURK|nr:hypothetical protein [Massilia genomosp. 1]